jgi:hypothetical protein
MVGVVGELVVATVYWFEDWHEEHQRS